MTMTIIHEQASGSALPVVDLALKSLARLRLIPPNKNTRKSETDPRVGTARGRTVENLWTTAGFTRLVFDNCELSGSRGERTRKATFD